MSTEQNSIPTYSINAVSEMTGVPSTTLRFWESRFGLIKPLRTEGGHRLYSSRDIERVKWIKQKIDEGIRTREAHALLAQELQKEGELEHEPAIKNAIMILVAEKDAITAELEEYFLKQEGYEVLVVLDGKKAIQEAEEKQPDLIIIELLLSGVNGIEVCKALKEKPKTKDIPIIVISALEMRDRALSAGADAFMLRPIRKLEMIESVKKMLA